jgi:toxin-antitoxin system PIN domain toxin
VTQLLDVNVWVAAAAPDHLHHQTVSAWMNAQRETLAFCRITQMGLLRTLSNPSAVQRDVITRRGAWRVFEALMADDRVRIVSEPDGLESRWMKFSARNDHSYRLWTDDYLAAFAEMAAATFVTLDTAIEARYPSVDVLTLR